MNTNIRETTQKVKAFLSKKAALYTEGIFLTSGKKNCMQISESVSKSHDTINRSLVGEFPSYNKQIDFFLKAAEAAELNFDKAFIIGDDTTVRHYGDHMESLSSMYSSIDSLIVKGYSIVLLCISDGTHILPLVFDFYMPRKFSSLDKPHRTKITIMQDLIRAARPRCSFKEAYFDGLYQSKAMMIFLSNLSIRCIVRFAKNRTVKLNPTDKPVKVGKHHAFKLLRNARSKRIKALVGGKEYFIIVQKRKNSSGDYETIYLISNFDTDTKNYLSLYMLRWPIEQIFRCSKQLLGLNDCQSRSLKKQKNHTFSVLAAFSIAEVVKSLNGLPNTPEGVRHYRISISPTSQKQEVLSNQVFDTYA
jgi:DDE family transposase